MEITESLFNESLLLADVDNDGDYELIVGQFNGDLVIFKGSSHKPWRICHHLGMITCVGAGDLKNNGENVLFCITAEGWCHIFHVSCSLTYVLKTCRWNVELLSCKIVFKCVLSNAFISNWNEYANTLPAYSIYANNKPFPSCSLPDWLKASLELLNHSNDNEFDLQEKHNSFPYTFFCSCFETEASNNSEMGY